jgi:hypothetical protein
MNNKWGRIAQIRLSQRFRIWLILFGAFHKSSHELWRWMLIRLGRTTGVFGDTDWLSSFRTASERVENDWLSVFYLDSEVQVINRLTQNGLYGLFSAGISLDLEGVYQSQIGFGGWLTTVIPTLLRLEGTGARLLIYSTTAAVSATIASKLVVLAVHRFRIPARLLVGFFFLQPWLLAFGSAPVLLFGLRLIPILWLISELRTGTFSARRVVLIASLLLVPGLASGYDYMTVLPGMMLACVAFYAVDQSWSFPKSLIAGLSVCASTGLAVLMTLGLHTLQLWLRLGSLSDAISTLGYRAAKRTGAIDGDIVDELLIEASRAPVQLVIDWYLAMPIFFAPARVAGIGMLTVSILLAVVSALWVDSVRKFTLRDDQSRDVLALSSATLVSALGPLSWYLLFRPSAYIHTHGDGVVWFFPTIPLGLLAIVSYFRHGWTSSKLRTPAVVFPVLTLVFVAVLSVLSRQWGS